MTRKWHQHYASWASAFFVVLLLSVWGLRTHHVLTAHTHAHDHVGHAHTHEHDDSEAPCEDECALCDWALAWFDIPSSAAIEWFVIFSCTEPTFFNEHAGYARLFGSAFLRGPPVDVI